MTKKRSVALTLLMMLMVHGCAKNETPSEIFEKVKLTYQLMNTYQAQGTVTSTMESGGINTDADISFSIVLKKPNLYLISWTNEDMTIRSGAVWNDGDQRCIYMQQMNAYSKIDNDEVALGYATGLSGGAAFTIPSFFLSVFKEQPAPFSRLKDPRIEKTEKIGQEDCYVISGPSSISKKETFWISKKSYLIRKYNRSLEPPEGGIAIPEMTDEQIEQAIKSMGQEVTEEGKQRVRAMMEGSKEALKMTHMKGSSTELYSEISSPGLDKKDFQFVLPEGVELKESLFGGILGGNKP
ncbi:MAG: hypothetical protein JXM79_03250 [Sedimentisphaerales bacterium]|nr:hypothetical protein [Sedimentisphaerales bacterium]